MTTQGSATRDAAELEQLEQLPPSLPTILDGSSPIDFASKEANSDTKDVYLIDQSTTIPAIDITGSEEIPDESIICSEVDSQQDTNVARSAPSVSYFISNLSLSDPSIQSPSKLFIEISGANPGNEQDRPPSPWTPSWSVTTQGNASTDLVELDGLEQLPPGAFESAEQPTAPLTEINVDSIQADHNVISSESNVSVLLHILFS